MTWYVVASEADANPEDDVWTLSENPDQEGWMTDFGCPGYGLPKSVAQKLADAANAADSGEYVLVPVTPTDEMLSSGDNASWNPDYDRQYIGELALERVWAKMIEAWFKHSQ